MFLLFNIFIISEIEEESGLDFLASTASLLQPIEMNTSESGETKF